MSGVVGGADPIAALTVAVAELKAAAEEFRGECASLPLAECVQAERLASDALASGLEIQARAHLELKKLVKVRP